MINKKQFPILEFDDNKLAKINPTNIISEVDVPEYCVIAFFSDVIEEMLKNNKLKQIGKFFTCTVALPIYETEYKGKRIGIVTGFLGSAGSAAELEELIAMGFKKFIVCGAAGVLIKEIQVGHLIVPYSAVRDEGTSYHYIEPSREVECNCGAVDTIEKILVEDNLPYIKAKTWTTDSFYRETEDKVKLRVSEGCVTVEMEAAALFAVAKFRGVKLGQILYGGDDLSDVEWDSRKWSSRKEVKNSIVELSMKICLSL